MGEVRGVQKVVQGCYVEMIKEDQKRAHTKGKVVDAPTIFEVHVLEEVTPRTSTLEEGKLVEIVEDKATRVASGLEQDMKDNLITYLKRNAYIFVRDVHDLTGIDSALMQLLLNITKGARLVKQRR